MALRNKTCLNDELCQDDADVSARSFKRHSLSGRSLFGCWGFAEMQYSLPTMMNCSEDPSRSSDC
jgi:hypothetical protein